ncbi:MAG: hypothetical protein ACRDGE_11050 [Candidatus Limnocylindria bacterium]
MLHGVPQEVLTALAIARAAGIDSVAGGVLGLVRRPSTLLMSIVFGFAGGTLLGSVAFEMIPKALELANVPLTAVAFGAGFLGLYAFDLLACRRPCRLVECDEGTIGR